MENPRRNNILEILTSHVNAPYSPCRHPQGDVKGTTLATAWFDLENAKMRLFKNNPCKALSDNLFVDYSLNIF
jgi:hypothetical protein